MTSKHQRGIVTGLPEWQPLLRAAEAAGIAVHSVRILQRHEWDGEARRNRPLPEIDVEIADRRTWDMEALQRLALEVVLRQAVPPVWNTPDLRFLWRKPPAPEFVDAMVTVRDKLWRDASRRRVSWEAYHDAVDRLSRVHHAVFDEAADHRPFMSELDEILAEARRHPEAPREIAPIEPGEIGVDEVMAVLRRIACGKARPNVLEPRTGRWRDLFHAIGEFECEGWRFEAWKRNWGIGYLHSVTAPDGRRAGYDDFERREGDPFCLLEDDEQDALERVLEAE
jgi:hypothetical protein